jgi:hypothetical protein
LETSLANEKVVSAPRVINCCLPISTTAKIWLDRNPDQPYSPPL